MESNWNFKRELVLERDRFVCVSCGEKNSLNIHHLTPRYAGGGDEAGNLITLCTACHAARHMTLQVTLSRRFIERWAHRIARWVDFDKVLPKEDINFGPILRLLRVDRFRPGQLDVILSALRGESVLYVSPTGSGKSLCFQIPALCRPNVELIFSPLKTLMLDQTRKLQKLGIPATFINSDISRDEKEIRFKLLERNVFKYVYLAPERFGRKVHPQELARLKKLRPSLLVLDEAHVMPKWGKAFRPDYDRIEAIRGEFDNPPILAFTATAGVEIQKRIINSLGAKNVTVFVRDIDRPNIYLAKRGEDDNQKRFALCASIIAAARRESGKVMIFVPIVKRGFEVQKVFAANGQEVPFYHAQLKMLERDSILNRFLGVHKPELDVVICTNAFGMGLDIPNIRAVIHWQYPASIEDYVQEFGRAGRDGKEALAMLFYNKYDSKDFGLQKFMIEKTLETSELSTEDRATEFRFCIARLFDMKQYALSDGECLRKQISRYFDNDKNNKRFNLAKIILNFVFTARSGEGKNFKCCAVCDGHAV
ncbi:MAG: RecQ family ATP-dependent DNA helicase [Parcubacteria group bacterium]